jgi:hypothetical protein
MPRYAILTHDHPFLHWDLLLEEGDHLRAWRLLVEPTFDVPIAAQALPDHRRMYLDYEGPVSNDRGTVARWDHGEYERIDAGAGELRLMLQGVRGFAQAVYHNTAEGASWTFGRSA